MSTTISIDEARELFRVEMEATLSAVRETHAETFKQLDPENAAACMEKLDRLIEMHRAEGEAAIEERLLKLLKAK